MFAHRSERDLERELCLEFSAKFYVETMILSTQMHTLTSFKRFRFETNIVPAPLKIYSHFANIAGAKGKKHKLFYSRFSPSAHDPSHNSDGSVQLG